MPAPQVDALRSRPGGWITRHDQVVRGLGSRLERVGPRLDQRLPAGCPGQRLAQAQDPDRFAVAAAELDDVPVATHQRAQGLHERARPLRRAQGQGTGHERRGQVRSRRRRGGNVGERHGAAGVHQLERVFGQRQPGEQHRTELRRSEGKGAPTAELVDRCRSPIE